MRSLGRGGSKGRAALFLDRDGVINEERGYVVAVEDFSFIDGIFSLCRTAQALGLVIVVVTNQSGIGRGMYTEADFGRLTSWMCDTFLREGITLSAVEYSPFHPTEGIGEYRRDSDDRKPAPGMLWRAAVNLGLDLAHSVLIGDACSDIVAASRAGVGTTILLGSREADVCQPSFCVRSLAEAEALIVRLQE